MRLFLALLCAPFLWAYPQVDYFTRSSNSIPGTSWRISGSGAGFIVTNYYLTFDSIFHNRMIDWTLTAAPNDDQYSYLLTDSWAGRNGEAAGGVGLHMDASSGNGNSCTIVASNSGVRKLRISRWAGSVETVLLNGPTSTPSIPDGSKLIGWTVGTSIFCKLMDSAGADILSTITTTDSTYTSGRVGVVRGENSQNITWSEWWGGNGTGTDIFVPPTVAGEYYVSSTATSHNATGTLADPWPHIDFWSNQPRVPCSSKVWFRGGTYQPTPAIYKEPGAVFIITNSCASNTQITYASFPGEQVLVDANASCGTFSGTPLLIVSGNHSIVDGWYHGWRWFNSIGDCKVITRCGSNPSTSPVRAMYNQSDYSQFKNLIWHDLGTGMGDNGSNADGTQVLGNLFFNNGYNAPDRRHGHGAYIHNDAYATITKYIKDSVFLRNAEQALQIYSQSGAPIGNINMDSSVVVAGRNDSGTWRGVGTGEGLLVQGSFPDNITLNKVYMYASDLRFNLDSVQAPNFRLTNSIFDGGTEINRVDDGVMTDNVFSRYGTPTGSAAYFFNFSTGTWADMWADINRNTYFNGRTGGTTFKQNAAQLDFAGFVALGQNAASTYDAANFPATGTTAGASSTNYIRVLPSSTLPGSGMVVVYNWKGSSSVSADVSTILNTGDPYEIIDIQNWTGGPVATGVYAGGNISLDMTLTAIQLPIGNYDADPGLTCTAGSDGGSPAAHDLTYYQHTETYFGTFMVRRRQVYRHVAMQAYNAFPLATRVLVESGPTATFLTFPKQTVACAHNTRCNLAIATQMVGNTYYRLTYQNDAGATIGQSAAIRIGVD